MASTGSSTTTTSVGVTTSATGAVVYQKDPALPDDLNQLLADITAMFNTQAVAITAKLNQYERDMETLVKNNMVCGRCCFTSNSSSSSSSSTTTSN